MTLHPSVMKRAQAEIDAHLGATSSDGGDRLPGLSDRDDLPYVEAIVKEVLRWGSILPLCEDVFCNVILLL